MVSELRDRRRWTASDDVRVRNDFIRGIPTEETAHGLGRTVRAIKTRRNRIGVPLEIEPLLTEACIERKCLRCHERFFTESRYMRVCNVCHENEEAIFEEYSTILGNGDLDRVLDGGSEYYDTLGDQ